MTGILLESGIVLIPLACAALYIIVSSNKLLFVFSLIGVVALSAIARLRYHFSSGAHSDLIVRTTKDTTAVAGAKKGKKSKSKKDGPEGGGEFDEIVKDAQNHRSGGANGEVVERSGPLLAASVTPESTKYDMELYGSALRYDHRCFYIEGRPVWVLAADFDYWRIPVPPGDAKKRKGDSAVEAWTRMLLQYKSMGFNAVRIRFHWGFHSPRKGVYDFTGNRDINRLLTLCEELGVLVIACLGPYIGNDVQGGGYPLWLIQRDHIRLRHVWRLGIKVWDDMFAAAEGEWYDQVISMVVGHEVVTKNIRGRGCIILVQLENHLAKRGLLELPLALQDETRLLARMARERVIRAPLLTNDLSWPRDFTSKTARVAAEAEKRLRQYRIIKDAYRADISGFTARDLGRSPVDLDSVARITRGDNVPMVAPELYKMERGVGSSFSDQIETALSQGLSAFSLPGFFKLADWGNFASPEAATDANQNSYEAVAEDGTLSGDARSARLVMHIARAFELQSAASDSVSSRPWISRADCPTVRGIHIHKLPENGIRVRRQWEYMAAASGKPSPFAKESGKTKVAAADSPELDGAEQLGLVAYVNGHVKPADADKEIAFMFSLADAPTLSKGGSFALTGTLGPRNRGIFVSNLSIGDNDTSLRLVASTKEIYTRIALPKENAEAWVCAEEEVQSGQLFFLGECVVSGHAEVEVVEVDHAKGHKFSFVIPKPGAGVINVTSKSGASVHIVLLAQQALDTLSVNYSTYGDANPEGYVGAQSAAAWGADGILMGPKAADIDVPLASACAKSHVVVISQEQPRSSVLTPLLADGGASPAYAGLPFIWQFEVNLGAPSAAGVGAVQQFEKRATRWDDLPWKLLPTMADLETMDEINLMSWQRDLGAFAYLATDIGRNGSHVLYRCQVRLKPQHIKAPKLLLQLNARHRCTIWVNGVNMSGHETVHRPTAEPGTAASWLDALRHPGSLVGPDRWGGTATYDVTRAMRISSADAEEGALNEVIVVVESYGLGAQADGANDARAPRGLIAAYWHGFNLIGEDHDDSEIHDHSQDKRTEQLRTKWEVCGVDVTQLSQSFSSSGFPDEAEEEGWSTTVERPFAQSGWSTRLNLKVNDGVQWWRWQLPPVGEHRDDPVYLHISGRVVAHVWVNGVLLAKHHADARDSSTLLRGGLGGQLHGLQSLQQSLIAADKVVVMMYGWSDHADTVGAAAGSESSDPAIAVELSITSRPATSAWSR